MSIVSEYRASAGYSNAGDPEGFKLASAYRATRQRLMAKGYDARPARCLAMARADVERGASFYPPESAALGALGAPGERGGRWAGDPEAAGFRFVGWSDEILSGRRNRHSGWYLFPDGDPAELARGCVYQLPARRGRPLFVEAIRTGEDTKDGWRDLTDGALLFVNCGGLHYGERPDYSYPATDDDAARDAALGADGEAESYAERERDTNEAWRAGQEARHAREDATAHRAEARGLIRELRCHFNSTGKLGDLLCATVREAIRQRIRKASEAAKRAAELCEAYRLPIAPPEPSIHAIRPRERALAESFAEGYGE